MYELNYSKLYSAIDYKSGHVVKPIQMLRFDNCVRCLPKEICKTCRKQTKGYSDGLCKRCAIGYTNAFYKMTEELLGVKIK